MVPEHGFDNHLIGSVRLFSDSRVPTLFVPNSPQNPFVLVVVGRIRLHEVASPNTPFIMVADMTSPDCLVSAMIITIPRI
jgi:hypothetical protein